MSYYILDIHIGLHRVFNFDETPAMTTPNFQAHGVYDSTTAAGAIRIGPEHNKTLTAVLTINLLGQMAMPLVIFPEQ